MNCLEAFFMGVGVTYLCAMWNAEWRVGVAISTYALCVGGGRQVVAWWKSLPPSNQVIAKSDPQTPGG